MTTPIANQKHLFDIPDHIVYLNCAYMSPLLTASQAAGHEGMALKVQPWKIRPDDFFVESENVRDLAGQLLNSSPDNVALIPSASYGIGTAAKNLPLAPGQEILVLSEQYPSNVYAWHEAVERQGARLTTVEKPVDGNWTPAIMDHISESTGVAALPHCHWTDGSLINLAVISEKLRSVGAALVVDATQSLGAMPLDVSRIQPDFLVAAAYKWLLGPYSTGILYAAPQRQNGSPLEQTWLGRAGSNDFASLVRYRRDYQPGARRFDVGERSNFALLPPLAVGLKQILSWTVEAIQVTLSQLTQYIAEKALEIDIRIPETTHRASHFIGLRFRKGVPDDLVKRLADCGIYVSQRGDSMRVTPHLYNSRDDIDRLFEYLKTEIRH